jgi:hypothetical protein
MVAAEAVVQAVPEAGSIDQLRQLRPLEMHLYAAARRCPRPTMDSDLRQHTGTLHGAPFELRGADR